MKRNSTSLLSLLAPMLAGGGGGISEMMAPGGLLESMFGEGRGLGECPGCASCCPAGLRKVLNGDLEANRERGDHPILESTRDIELQALDRTIEVALQINGYPTHMYETLIEAAGRTDDDCPEAKIAKILLNASQLLGPLLEEMTTAAKQEADAKKQERQAAEETDRAAAEMAQLEQRRRALDTQRQQLEARMGEIAPDAKPALTASTVNG